MFNLKLTLFATFLLSVGGYDLREEYNCTQPLRECEVFHRFEATCYVYDCQPQDLFPCQVDQCPGVLIHEYYSYCLDVQCREIEVPKPEVDYLDEIYSYDEISGNETYYNDNSTNSSNSGEEDLLTTSFFKAN